MKSYKYKLKPSPKIVAMFELWLRLLCELYNAALKERIDAYKIAHISIGYKQQANQLPEIKKIRTPFKKIHSQVSQETLRRLEDTFQRFFDRVKEGKGKAGFPRYKRLDRFKSFKFPQSGFKLDQKTKKLRLSKIGTISMMLSRPIEGKIKTCTIKREADGWYVILVVEEAEKKVEQAKPETVVGIDVGLKSFAVTSEGEEIENPRHLRKAESDLKKAQRKVSRRKKKGKRRKKAIRLLAKKHMRVARQRRDFHFKVAGRLVQRYTVIKFEDLNIKGMVKNHHLSKSISDAGWATFIELTVFKAGEAGRRVEKVNASGTSTKCSRCGHRQAMPLSIRIFRCGNCRLVINRDHNSGINIKEREGRAALSGRRKDASAKELRTSRSSAYKSRRLKAEPESLPITRPRA